jgi:hypothetical protein
MAKVNISLETEIESRSSDRSELLQQAIIADACTYVPVVSIVSMFTRLLAGRSEVRIPWGPQDLSLLQNVQTVCGVHPLSYPMFTGILPPAKSAGAWGWQLTST